MNMIQVDIADGFPVKLICLSDATIVVSPMGRFPAFIEETPLGVSSVFALDGFSLRGEGEEAYADYSYNVPYAYKQMPVLLAWLCQQSLISPI